MTFLLLSQFRKVTRTKWRTKYPMRSWTQSSPMTGTHAEPRTRDAMVPAYADGRQRFGEVPLSFEAFSRGVRERVERRLVRAKVAVTDVFCKCVGDVAMYGST